MRKQLAIMAILVTSLFTMPAMGDSSLPALIQSLALDREGLLLVKLRGGDNYYIKCSTGSNFQACVSFRDLMWDTLLRAKLADRPVSLFYALAPNGNRELKGISL